MDPLLRQPRPGPSRPAAPTAAPPCAAAASAASAAGASPPSSAREPEPAWVLKRDGERQRFDRAKLRGALLRASHKRDVDPRALEAIVDRIEARGRATPAASSRAERIGELCLEGLEPLDRGAFLQFAGTLPDDAPRRLSEIPAKTRRSEAVGSVRDRRGCSTAHPDSESEREESI